MARTWLISGASRGLGREFAMAALRRGDLVAVTARDVEAVDDLVKLFPQTALAVPLDVTDPEAAQQVAATAVDAFGRLDILVNNAAIGMFGLVEEITPEQLRELFEVNVIGCLNVLHAFLPTLRRQRKGHVVQVSSSSGIFGRPPVAGYAASKHAVEALIDALAIEVACFGISTTLLQLGAFNTGMRSRVLRLPRNPAYSELHASLDDTLDSTKFEDPSLAARALLRIVDCPDPPSRVIVGTGLLERAVGTYTERTATWLRGAALLEAVSPCGDDHPVRALDGC